MSDVLGWLILGAMVASGLWSLVRSVVSDSMRERMEDWGARLASFIGALVAWGVIAAVIWYLGATAQPIDLHNLSPLQLVGIMVGIAVMVKGFSGNR